MGNRHLFSFFGDFAGVGTVRQSFERAGRQFAERRWGERRQNRLGTARGSESRYRKRRRADQRDGRFLDEQGDQDSYAEDIAKYGKAAAHGRLRAADRR